MDIKILVATHKKYWMPHDDVYLPIQVGAEGKEDFGYLRDNTGDNISYKNPNYCELTALYWAWKNLKCDYIGLCHYRRYFTSKKNYNFLKGQKSALLRKKDFENILKNYDLILPKPNKILPQQENNYSYNIRTHYENNHYKKDLLYLEEILSTTYPNYTKSFSLTMNSNVMYFCNSFVMPKKIFDDYCQWLFTILFKLETVININDYNSYQKRIFGFISERLLNVYIKHHSFTIYESDYSLLKEYHGFKLFINNLQNKLFYS